MIQLNANAGTSMFASSKAELVKYLDVVNSHNLDQESKRAEGKYAKLKQLTAQILAGDRHSELVQAVFTGTGTEANCLAIKSVVQFLSCQTCDLPEELHIVASQYEHKSILSCLEHLSHEHSPYKKRVSVTLIKPRASGQISAEDVLAGVKSNTVLVTVMAINNETGADNRKELVAIGEGLRALRASRKLPLFFHSDCVQAFGKYQVPFEQAGIDMASVSFYKVFGPNRIGALAVGKKALGIITQHPLINTSLLESDSTHGGTQSMALVAAALNSLKVVSINRHNKNKRLAGLRKHLDTKVREVFRTAEFLDIHRNWEQHVGKDWLLVSFSPVSHCIPNTFMFTLIRRLGGALDAPCGHKLLSHMAQMGIIVATGSACGQTGSATTGNSVLGSMGVPEKLQQSAIRVSFCDTTLKKELEVFVAALKDYLLNHYK